jgi:ABC-2 type transport system ATP-binding protein
LGSQPSNSAAVETMHLSKRFGQVTAVQDVSLTVRAGTVYGLLGPNGAGKTTTMRLLVGLVRPDAGSVLLLGRPVSSRVGIGRAVGAMIERPSFYPYLSGFDNLQLFATAKGMGTPTLKDSLRATLRQVGLDDARDRKVGGYSTGMRQRLAIALALIGSPSLLLLDEPVNGLDPEGVADIRDLIREMSAGGGTILLSSHLLAEIELLCHEVGIISEGRLLRSGPLTDLTAGSTVHVTFRTTADRDRALAVLRQRGFEASRDGTSSPSASVVTADGSEVVAALAPAGLFPTEIRLSGSTLEEAFLRVVSQDREQASLEDKPQ